MGNVSCCSRESKVNTVFAPAQLIPARRSVSQTLARRQMPSIPANAPCFMTNEPEPSRPGKEPPPHAADMPHGRTLSRALHHLRTIGRKSAESGLAGPVAPRPSCRRLQEPCTALQKNCTRIVQAIYAGYLKHPPFTHFTVWTGNISPGCATYCTALHHGNLRVKPNKKTLGTRVLCGFYRPAHATEEKSTSTCSLCTVVASTPDIVCNAPLKVDVKDS